MKRPEMKPINGDEQIQKLKDLCEHYMNMAESGGYSQANKTEYYIFESAIEMFYGSEVWEWVNFKLP